MLPKQPKKAAVTNDKKKKERNEGLEHYIKLYKFYFPECESLQDLSVSAYTTEQVRTLLGADLVVSPVEAENVVEAKEVGPVAYSSYLDADDAEESLAAQASNETAVPPVVSISKIADKEEISKRFVPLSNAEEVRIFLAEVVASDYKEGFRWHKASKMRDALHCKELGNLKTSKGIFPLHVMDFGSLLPLEWLNDEAINFYVGTILFDRLSADSRVGIFSSFFYAKLLEVGVGDMKRWHRKDSLHLLDKIVVPINVNNMHWVLAVVDRVRKEIRYYDSYQLSGKNYCQAVLDFYAQWISLHSDGGSLNLKEWKFVNVKGFKKQLNNHDCGVYVCMFADLEMNKLPLSLCPPLTTSLLSEYRLRIACELKAASF